MSSSNGPPSGRPPTGRNHPTATPSPSTSNDTPSPQPSAPPPHRAVVRSASAASPIRPVDTMPKRRSTVSRVSVISAPPFEGVKESPSRPLIHSGRSQRIQPPPPPNYLDDDELYRLRQYLASRRSNRSSRLYAVTNNVTPHEYMSVKDILVNFCVRTSSHGIPHIPAHSLFGPYVWSMITAVAFMIFCTQTYLTMSDFFTYRTIIEMQLKFEPAPFPAATVCSLNAFKLSELKKYEEFEQGFILYEKAISLHSNLTAEGTTARRRRKRSVHYRPVYVKCVCNSPDDQCVPQRNPLELNTSVCICYEDAKTGDIWPCYPATVWTTKTCYHCSNSQTCDDPDKPNITSLLTTPQPTDCICQSVSHYCMVKNRTAEVPWWDPDQYAVFPATDAPSTSREIKDVFDVSELRDRGAITTKTKENLIFMVAAMPREVRQNLSYTLDEFVLRCSFNSEDCDIERDFQLHLDPEYGNCYTFNFNDSVELKNSRAGPMYGLRLLLNVNQSDYLPTTEAAGIRLIIHEQDQEPFPDTFGYSAPTGFVSSFGLKTKVLHRLNEPYGQCSDTFRPENYIYAEHYSPEGCYRNCFQQIILQRCGCGDPRFPLPFDNNRPCNVRSAKDRQCLLNQTSVLGGFHHLTADCHCVQPCTENVFETAYSAASWPALNFHIGADCERLLNLDANDSAACAEYYRLNTAYIEIFYEQLNYETLRETPGYTLVNLFSDLGGNIGLWIGFSLITFLEFFEVLCELCLYATRKPRDLLMRRRLERRRRREEAADFDSYLHSQPSLKISSASDTPKHSATSPRRSILSQHGVYRRPRPRHTSFYADNVVGDVVMDERKVSIDDTSSQARLLSRQSSLSQ